GRPSQSSRQAAKGERRVSLSTKWHPPLPGGRGGEGAAGGDQPGRVRKPSRPPPRGRQEREVATSRVVRPLPSWTPRRGRRRPERGAGRRDHGADPRFVRHRVPDAAPRRPAPRGPCAGLADIAWSRDGGRLEFPALDPPSGRTALFSVDAAGETPPCLERSRPDGARLSAFSSARAGRDGAPLSRSSPCGRRLAFVASGEGAESPGLWVEDVLRGERRRLPAGLSCADRVEAIDWTPDAQRIVFT